MDSANSNKKNRKKTTLHVQQNILKHVEALHPADPP